MKLQENKKRQDNLPFFTRRKRRPYAPKVQVSFGDPFSHEFLGSAEKAEYRRFILSPQCLLDALQNGEKSMKLQEIKNRRTRGVLVVHKRSAVFVSA